MRSIAWKDARVFILGLFLSWPVLPAAIVAAIYLNGPGRSNFSGGLSWPAIIYAFWEPFVAWGLIAGWLLVFRTCVNRNSRLLKWLDRRAYAVYILHPPVLVGLALLVHPWAAPAAIKFLATGALTCLASWGAADLVVRIPGLRQIV
jgi:Acyltransferase family